MSPKPPMAHQCQNGKEANQQSEKGPHPVRPDGYLLLHMVDVRDGRKQQRSPTYFCNAHCLAEWARYISDEADRQIRTMGN